MKRMILAFIALLLTMGVADAAPRKKQVEPVFSCYHVQEPMEWISFGVQVAVNPKSAIAWKVVGTLIEEFIPDREFKDGLWFVLDPIGGVLQQWMKNTQTRDEWETACWVRTIWNGYRLAQDIKGLRQGGGGWTTKVHKHKRVHHHHHRRHHHHHHHRWHHKRR